MKKILKHLIFICLLFIPFGIKAYGIDNYYIDAKVEENGDLLVQEYFNLTGTYNGFERIINYSNDDLYEFDSNMSSFGGSLIHNGDELEIIEVRAIPIDSKFSFENIRGDIFYLSSNASKGDYGVYEENNTTGGKSILIYNPSSYNSAFYIKYRIKNMAIRHNDIGEIGWNVIGNQLSESIGNLTVYLHIPGNTNNLRTWAHGPLNGIVSIIDQENILLTINSVSSYKAIDLRATFDLNVINQSKKMTNVDALNKIILYEEDKAEQANYERQNKEKIALQNAIESLNLFEIYVTRYDYENAKNFIEVLPDSYIKIEYLNRLSKTKKLLDEKEEETARIAIEYALENLKYIWYEAALEKVEVIDNSDVKEELLQELEIVLEEVKKQEIKTEIINYIIGFIILFSMIIICYLIYRFYRKDPDTEFNEEYFRDVPSDDSPEIVSYLLYGKIKHNAFSASILNLIRKKVIIATKIDENHYDLKRDVERNNELTQIEQSLIDLIFAGKTAVTTSEINNYAKNNYDKFIEKWGLYQRIATNEAKEKIYYENDLKAKKVYYENNGKVEKVNGNNISSLVALLIFMIIFVIMSVSLTLALLLLALIITIYIVYKLVHTVYTNLKIKGQKTDYKKILFIALLMVFGTISLRMINNILTFQQFYKSSVIVYIGCIILPLIILIIVFEIKKRTVKGAEEYKKWKALKNFLKDFGKFDDKEISEITLWEKYLVYATLFGCSEKILKIMKLKLENYPDNSLNTYRDLYDANRYITNSINDSYYLARSAYTAAHSSSSSSSRGSSGGFSSGSGGGGGFSSGGGSFGGGGGGDRF